MNLSAATTQVTQSQQNQHNANTRLSGRWLILARVVWIVLVLFLLGVFFLSLPASFAILYQSCNSVWCMNSGNDLLFSSSIWRIPEIGVYLIDGLAILFTLALFPNGRFVPRWAVWITLINPAYYAVYLLFLRPLRIPGWALIYNPLNAVAWFGCWIILTLAQLYRYFRVSNTLERQQTKWVAFSFFIVLAVGFVGLDKPLPIQHNGLLNVLITNSFSLISLLIPISLGLAMFRYRLWDIDVIINRTLVYGTLTAILALVYFGLVIGLESLVHLFTGQAGQSPVVIVVSTLVIAALFQPLRHRLQRIIDRRFYRSKYDATKTLEAFSATLRSEVDLSQLSGHLLNVVQETMQPTQVSLWLRPSKPAGKQQTPGIETPPASSQTK